MLNKSGVTLAEVAIAFLLFGIAVLPIFGTFMGTASNAVVIESERYAQEQGFNIITAVLERVPFECVWASSGEWQPGSIRAQPMPSTVDDITYDANYASNLVASIFPGSLGACYCLLKDSNGVGYEVLLEVTDISDLSPTDFSGTNFADPSTWKELYFDFYPLPDFHTQPNWDSPSNVNNDGIIGVGYTTPYRYFSSSCHGKLWGPAERAKNGASQFRTVFPRDQKDRTNPWSAWGNIYCQMKKLRLRIRWNLTIREQADPLAASARKREIQFIAYKANI